MPGAVRRGERMDAAEVAEPFSNDLDWLALARDGSDEAARMLVGAHGPSMLRTAWHVLARYGSHEAEDVVQEAFIAALTTGAVPRGDVGAWLRAITARKALDALRGAKRRAERPLPEADAVSAPPVPSLETLAVREALARLPPADRALLVLVDLEGRTMEEAAAALSATNVGTRLRAVRARRKLAKLLRGKETT